MLNKRPLFPGFADRFTDARFIGSVDRKDIYLSSKRIFNGNLFYLVFGTGPEDWAVKSDPHNRQATELVKSGCSLTGDSFMIHLAIQLFVERFVQPPTVIQSMKNGVKNIWTWLVSGPAKA